MERDAGREAFAQMIGGGENGDLKTLSSPAVNRPKATGSSSTTTNSVQCLTKDGFKALSDISKCFLDWCGKLKDYKKALALMRVTNVFYNNSENLDGMRHRTFLGDMLQKHKFWKNLSFWRYALKSAVLMHNFRNRKDEEYQSFIQGWLVENLHKMVIFNVDFKEIESFVADVMTRHSLQMRRKEEIHTFVTRMKELREAEKMLRMAKSS